MNTYLLFLNGLFETPMDLDNFSKEFMEKNKSISSPKFIIENRFNVIVVFDSLLDDEDISHEIKENISEHNVRFYFLFNREALMVANIPQEISAIIFKDLPKNSSLEIRVQNYKKEPEVQPVNYNDEVYVDALLEKIDKFGIGSLTENEKKYLDNFNK